MFIIKSLKRQIFLQGFIGNMKDKITLFAKERKIVGKKVKTLRREGILPANVYGKDVASTAVQVDYKDFEEVFRKSGETQLVYLVLGKEEVPVLIHNVQKDPVTGVFLHADFMKVSLKEKVTTLVPVEGVGESPAEKQGLGTVVFHIDELEVEALPTDIPEKIEVDLSGLSEVGQSILVSDLEFDRTKLEIKANPSDVVVKVESAKEEKEEQTETQTEVTEIEPPSQEQQSETKEETSEK